MEFNDELNLSNIADVLLGTSEDAAPVGVPSPVVVNPLYVYYKMVICTDTMIK